MDRPNVEQCEAIFHAALSAGDARGVEAALMVMAPQDPDRAQVLLDSVRLGLALAAAQRREQSEPSKSPKQDVTNRGRSLTEDAP